MELLEALRSTPLSLSEISRRSGVSRNTLNLWLRGESQPQKSALEKVMPVLGYDLVVQARRMSDARAAAAARKLCGEDIEVQDLEIWAQRFEDWGDSATEYSLISRAAWASNPYGRAEAVHFLPIRPLRVASAVDARGQHWAFSGAHAIEAGVQPRVALSQSPSMTIVWCEDPVAAVAGLPDHIRRTPNPVAGGISVIPAQAGEFLGAQHRSGLYLASPVQVAIDVLAEQYAREH